MSEILLREGQIKEIKELLRIFPVVAILGPRQVGKTTIAKQLLPAHRFDLESPRDALALEEAQAVLERLAGLVMLDEIQLRPNLFPIIRVLVDEQPDRRYLLLGSASRDLIHQSSESLAGRIAYYPLTGFLLGEVPTSIESYTKLWVRGGLPRSFFSESEKSSFLWRDQYIGTFLNQDIPQLGIKIPFTSLFRFWTMISHYHGQLLNYSELARSFGMSDFTVRRYLEILEGTFMIRLLSSWQANTKKRLIKASKLYIRDSGIFHSLQTIPDFPSLLRHPKLGASFEGFAIEQMLSYLRLPEHSYFFYRTHPGAEIDLVWERNGKRYGVEIKYADAPKINRGNYSALEDLQLTKLFVIYPGDRRLSLSETIEWIPIHEIQNLSLFP